MKFSKFSKTIIITLGFEEKFTMKTITKHGIEKGDKVILLIGSKTEKVDKAIREIKNFIYKYFKDIEIKIIEINVHNFLDAINQIKEILRKEKEIIVNITGGMRILILSTFFASLFSKANIKIIEMETEDGHEIIFPTEITKILNILENVKKLNILKNLLNIKKEIWTVDEMVKVIKKDKSTIRRYIAFLKKCGFITIKTKKPLTIQISPIVKILF